MLKDCHFKYDYDSGINEPRDFFTEAMIESKTFDLGLGFFSSTAICSLSYGFAIFIANGGKMRIMINDVLSKKDKQAIIDGQKSRIEDEYCDKIIADIEKMKATLSKVDDLFFRCFTYLISCNRLEFIATLSTKGGLAHDKYGIFTDERGDKVAFIGSVNFTKTALEQNAESLTTFTSWEDPLRVANYQNKFNTSWNSNTPHIIHIPIERVKAFVKENFNTKDLRLLLREGVNIRDLDDSTISNNSAHQFPDYILKKMEFKESEPRFPFPEEREIQKNAYKAWIGHNCKGIFAMATGSGKTVTALNCVLKLYNRQGFYKAIIVVPTKSLALQWEIEVKSFNFQNIISTQTEIDWKNILSRYETRSIFNQKINIIIITTYATFVRTYFQNFIKRTRGIDSFIFIADEAHNLGAPGPLNHLPEKINYRIGLSATPERIYDETGSSKLYDFFASHPPKYTYRFTMKDAIESKILCHYDYQPIFVTLTHDEMKQYYIKTEQLRKFIDTKTGKYKKEANMLLMARKRIIHKAANKKIKVAELLDTQKSRGHLDYTFVFVPEGFEPDYAEIDDYEIDNDDIHIIDEYSDMFKERKYSYHQYISGIDDAPSILKGFERGDIQILLSMKCLDEGVDIPRAQNAIFISSTGNPRQFIQRRGRVLRKCEGKDKAYIWDMVVVPPNINDGISNTDRNLFIGEVNRIINFAALADNKIDILYGDLHQLCSKLNIDEMGLLEKEEEHYK